MREISTELPIKASAGDVWDILTDFGAFPQWNPFIRKAEGEPVEGARLTVRIEPPGGRAITFKPTLKKVTPNRELRWLGHVLIPGLFDGEHIFEIEARGDHVRFIQREQFSGLLVPLLWNSLKGSTRQGFHEMNVALKQRAEGGSHAS